MTYRLFRATYTKDGETKESAKWYVEFRDQLQTVRRLAGFTSKSATDELGRNLVKLVEYHGATGGQVDPALSRWLAGLASGIRERLVAIGLLDGVRSAAAKPLTEHVADWSNALTAKTTTAKQVEQLASRLNRVLADCGFKFYSDISATKVQAVLADWRADTEAKRGMSAQTSNFYLSAVKQFCRWMVRHGRAPNNPVDHLEPLNVDLDRRHDRRALTVNEVKKLLNAAADSATRGGMPGPERRLLYLLALETGLRANELRSLTRSSFDLNERAPTVTVSAGYSKRRREDSLPLRPALAVELRAHLLNKLPSAPAFNAPGNPTFTRMFQFDIGAAGIEYRDADGRVADFHALRHTFVTNVVNSGVMPKVAQALARHSTITLTMDRYSHTLIGEQADALKGLPDLTGPVANEMRKTGTDDRNAEKSLACCLAFSGAPRETSMDSGTLAGGEADEDGGNASTPENPSETLGFSGVEVERPRPDLNRGMTVLQTVALPLGYEADHDTGMLAGAAPAVNSATVTTAMCYRISAARAFNFLPSSFIRRLHSSRAVVNPAAVAFPLRRYSSTTDSASMNPAQPSAVSAASSIGIVVTPLRSPCSRSPGFTHTPPTRTGTSSSTICVYPCDGIVPLVKHGNFSGST